MTELNKLLVKKILDNPLEYDWSLQGLGMLRLYLDNNYRLHIWDTRFKVDNVSELHTHPWDFESTVVVGKVQNQRCVEVDGEPTHFKQSIFCGPGGGLEGDPVRVRLEELAYEIYEEGETYQERAEEIHVSTPKTGTVTIVKRFFKEDIDHAFVYWEDGNWVNAEPRKATSDEIGEICDYSLSRWF